MSEPRNHLPLDLTALRYLDALDAGDLEAVASLWDRASHDPELERTLVELDAAMLPELAGKPSTPPEKPRRRKHRWAVALGTLAAACLLGILVWPPGETTSPAPIPSDHQAATGAARPSSALSHNLTPLLSARRNLDEAAIPGFVWPLENALSASTRRDLLD